MRQKTEFPKRLARAADVTILAVSAVVSVFMVLEELRDFWHLVVEYSAP